MCGNSFPALTISSWHPFPGLSRVAGLSVAGPDKRPPLSSPDAVDAAGSPRRPYGSSRCDPSDSCLDWTCLASRNMAFARAAVKRYIQAWDGNRSLVFSVAARSTTTIRTGCGRRIATGTHPRTVTTISVFVYPALRSAAMSADMPVLSTSRSRQPCRV